MILVHGAHLGSMLAQRNQISVKDVKIKRPVPVASLMEIDN
jgi:hypothetical protein